MKHHIQDLLRTTLYQLQAEGELPDNLTFDIQVEQARDSQYGDFASNIAMVLAKRVGKKPRDLAEVIVAKMPLSTQLNQVSIAGPGFINFTLKDNALQSVLNSIFEAGDDYGKSHMGDEQKIYLEFVSANPTGPLHVGHGRHAAYGATLGNLLRSAGYDVYREYYVNDAGRQMDILALSVWVRYLQLFNPNLTFPNGAYQGEYIKNIASDIKTEHSDNLVRNLEINSIENKDEIDSYLDNLINQAKELLDNNYDLIHKMGLENILGDIKQDLAEFGVEFDNWFSEKKLTSDNLIQHAIDKLQTQGQLYERDGALWFRATDFGDDKDRVVKRENGQTTYFASDIAYHLYKAEQQPAEIIDVFGSDHHGYVARIKAGFQAMDINPDNFHVKLVQFVTLYRGKEQVQMSTRSGSFVTLRELRDEVGNDAARFFYVQRKCEQHMDFDMELAKSQTQDNPVYYIQYAHARICSVFRQCDEKKIKWEKKTGLDSCHTLTEPHEKQLLLNLARYPELIEIAAKKKEPHQLANYLRELAHDFHTYYNAHQFIVEDQAVCQARLTLINATKIVLTNGLSILGVSAPETM